VVLPEPLSPTMPKVSPLYMSKLTPLTALNRCQLLPKVTSRSRTFSSTSLSRVSNCFPSQLLQFADNLGRLHLGGTGVQQPGACPVRRGNIEIRGLFQVVNLQRQGIAGSKGIPVDFLEQVGRRAFDGVQLL